MIVELFYVLLIIIPVIPILLIIGAIVKTEYRKEFLKQINISEDTIMVENCELNNSGFIINELRKVVAYIKHHSSAINHIELKFKKNGFKFMIASDQEVRDELWVFYKEKEIGRITNNQVYKDIYYGNCADAIKLKNE